MAKLTLQTLVQSGVMAPTGVFGAIGAFNGYYYAGVLFVISIVLIVVLSYMTDAPPEEKVEGLTYESAGAKRRRTGVQVREPNAATAQSPVQVPASEHPHDEPPRSKMPEIIGTTIVLVLVVGVYIYFSFWL